jgi:aryl-alcohol dehydrogenase
MDLHLQGRLPFDRLISRFDFEQINEAAAAAVDGSVIKPVLTMRR